MKDIFVRSIRRIRRSDLIDTLNIEVARLRIELDQKLAEVRSHLAMREQAHLEFAALRDGQLAQLKQDLSDRREVAESLVREADRVRSERDALAERTADREALLARARSELVQLTVERDALAAKEIGLRAEAVRLDQERAAALGAAEDFRTQVADLQARLETRQREIELAAQVQIRLQQEADQAAQQLGALTREAESLRRMLAEASANAEDAYRQKHAAATDALQLSESVARLADAMEAVKATAGEELARARAEVGALAGERDSLRAECDRLGASEAALIAEMALATASEEQKRNEKQVAPAVARMQTIRSLRSSGARQRLLHQLLLNADTGVPDRRAIFTLHKTASMFVSSLMGYLADILNLPIHSPNAVGAEYVNDEINIRSNMRSVEDRSGLFGPFRGYVDFPPGTFSRTVVILRDPRDILVSMYFSWAYSHPIDDGRLSLVNAAGELYNPSEETKEQWRANGPDEFVLEFAGFVEKNMRAYIERVISQPNATLMLYEHFIANQTEWMRRLLVGLGAAEPDIEWLLPSIVENFAAEFKPRAEDKHQHIRQMLPGDHKRKLREDTIALLTRRFAFYFDAVEKLAGRLPDSPNRGGRQEAQDLGGSTPAKSAVRSIGPV